MQLPTRTLLLTLGLVVALGLSTAGSTDDVSENGPSTVAAPPPFVGPAFEADPGRRSPRQATPTAPLTGVELTDEEMLELAERPATVVKIPNNELAHPHRGIEHADVVYEQETEGGTTRFAAVFHSRIPEVVGNVRSARPVDIALVAPYRGVFVYAGARAEVLDLIEVAELVSVGAGGPGYFTDPARNAPHHLYIRLDEALVEREAPPPLRKPWTFDERPPEGGSELPERLRILMSPIAATSWEWDEQAGLFRRFQNDRPHEVTGPDRIGAANVVVLDVPVDGRDSAGAPVYVLDGAGPAWLLRDGRVHRIAWSKAGDRGQLRLVDDEDEANLAPGPTWVVLTYDGVLESLEGQLPTSDDD